MRGASFTPAGRFLLVGDGFKSKSRNLESSRSRSLVLVFADLKRRPGKRSQELTVRPGGSKLLTDTADGMTDNEQRPGYRDPKKGGPDRLLMFLVLAFVGMVLLRAFWLFH